MVPAEVTTFFLAVGSTVFEVKVEVENDVEDNIFLGRTIKISNIFISLQSS
jgi:hypothetical protein